MREHDEPSSTRASQLLRSTDSARSRNLVYTSAGDRSSIHRWVEGAPEFDLWVTYYGDSEFECPGSVQYLNRRKGSKYQNLNHAWKTWPELFLHYDAILVADDDIVIDASRINRLFEYRAELDLWVLQPGFDPRGKISHAHTRSRGGVRYKLTNFIECNVPLFRGDKLREFLEQYDESIAAYGVDWWYTEVLGLSVPGRAAVIDEVVCVNPLDRAKGGGREVDRFQSSSERIRCWESICVERGLRGQAIGKIVYGVRSQTGLKAVLSNVRSAFSLTIAFPRRCGQYLNKKLKRARARRELRRVPHRA